MVTARKGPPTPHLQPSPCLGHSYCFYLIPWTIILEADSAFPLLTFVSPNAQHWKAPERGTSFSFPLASSMAAIPGCSNRSHTGDWGATAGGEGPAVNLQWGAEGTSQGVGGISLLTAYPATENTLRAPITKPSHPPAPLLTCRAAGCGGFHDGISRTWVSHNSDPSPHHPCTTSPLAVDTLGRTWKVHQTV